VSDAARARRHELDWPAADFDVEKERARLVELA
jgi:hypothetical protein